MRSLVIIEVEHGETTDPLDEFVNATIGLDFEDLTISNYTLRVDLPECFVLD
jgi:hypothetical protein